VSVRPVRVYYEDSWGEAKQFGLHELLVACVADILDIAPWELKHEYEAWPTNGNAKLLAVCRDQVPRMPDPIVIAVFDADKLHKLLFASGRPPEADIIVELRRRCPDPRLHIFLLTQNTETVVDAATDCLGIERVEKDPISRDRQLNLAAGIRSVRDCIISVVPSLAACVAAIARLVTHNRG
jgi:hypothetical protein